MEIRPACDVATIRATLAEPTCPQTRRGWVLLTSVLGSGLAFLLATAETVALPAIQVDFSVSTAGMLWVVNAYLLTLGAAILVGGSAGDRFGKRRIFGIGVAIFGVATLWCGLASSLAELLVARMVQGAGGALLVPNSLALIGAAYPEEQRGRAIGTWSAASAVTTAMGPIAGGWLVDALSWRWTFLAVVPVAVLTGVVAFLRVPEFPRTVGGRLDFTGAILATAGLGALSLGLIRSAEAGLGEIGVLSSLGGGAAGIVAFIAHERRVSSPMMPLSLFRSRAFAGANAMTLLLYGALTAALFFLPFDLIQVRGLRATEAGLALLPLTVFLGLFSRWAGILKDRFGPRIPLTIGPLIAGGGFALLALGTDRGSYWTALFPGLATLGGGLALAVAPLTSVVFDAAPEGREGVASGINNAAARVAGLLAIAALGAAAIGVFGRELEGRMDRLEVPQGLRQEMRERASDLAAAVPPPGVEPRIAATLDEAIDGSFLSAFRVVMFISAALAVLSALCAAVTIDRPGKASGGTGGAPRTTAWPRSRPVGIVRALRRRTPLRGGAPPFPAPVDRRAKPQTLARARA